MQVSAAELLAALRRVSGTRSPSLPPEPNSGETQQQGRSAWQASVPSVNESAAAPARDKTAEEALASSDGQGSDGPGGADAQGAQAPMVHRLPGEYPNPLYDVEALQLWLLQCCQTVRSSTRFL